MAQRLPEGPLGRFLEPADRPPRRSALTLRFEDESMTDDRMKAMDEDERQAVFTALDAAPNMTEADKSFVKASLWTQGEVPPVTSDEQARAYERKADEIQAAAGVPDGSSPDWTVRLSGPVYCHKAMRKSYSELGFRRGRSAPSAMACGRSKAYRPRKLMCLKRSGETLAMSVSLMSQPSRLSWSMAAWM